MKKITAVFVLFCSCFSMYAGELSSRMNVAFDAAGGALFSKSDDQKFNTGYSIGVGANILINSMFEVKNLLKFSHLDATTNTDIYSSTYDFVTVSSNLQICLPNDKSDITPYVSLGATEGIMFYKDYDNDVYNYSSSNLEKKRTQVTFCIGLSAGAGCKFNFYKNTKIDVFYEFGFLYAPYGNSRDNYDGYYEYHDNMFLTQHKINVGLEIPLSF
jgi:hypothetical protein